MAMALSSFQSAWVTVGDDGITRCTSCRTHTCLSIPEEARERNAEIFAHLNKLLEPKEPAEVAEGEEV